MCLHGEDAPSGMFTVGNRVTNHVPKQNGERPTCLHMHQTGDTLHAATSSQTPDGLCKGDGTGQSMIRHR